MISVPVGTGDISSIRYRSSSDDICLRHMKERILYHTCVASISYGVPYIISRQRYIIEKCNIFDKIPMKEGVFMSENKLLDLSFEFAVAIVSDFQLLNAQK